MSCHVVPSHVISCHGMAWQGNARQGMAWHGLAWRGVAWHCVANQVIPYHAILYHVIACRIILYQSLSRHWSLDLHWQLDSGLGLAATFAWGMLTTRRRTCKLPFKGSPASHVVIKPLLRNHNLEVRSRPSRSWISDGTSACWLPS